MIEISSISKAHPETAIVDSTETSTVWISPVSVVDVTPPIWTHPSPLTGVNDPSSTLSIVILKGIRRENSSDLAMNEAVTVVPAGIERASCLIVITPRRPPETKAPRPDQEPEYAPALMGANAAKEVPTEKPSVLPDSKPPLVT